MKSVPDPSISLPDELTRFFDGFLEAFSSFSGPRIATRYFVPGVALRADGSIQCLQSRVEVERLFQVAGGRSVLGTVTWELLREDGSVIRQWRQSYNLVRVETGWQILAST